MAPTMPGPKKDDSYVQVLMDELTKRTPEPYKGYVVKATPVVVLIGDAVDNAWPYVVAAFNWLVAMYEKLQPYGPEQYLPLVCGIGMCFFGGSFLLLIAAVEAARASALPQLQKSVTTLIENAKKAIDAKKKDDAVDADGDGVADVLQISKQQRLSRTLIVVAGAVDPTETSTALSALWICFLSIVATLKLHFAKCITLGANLASMVYDNVHEKIDAAVADVLPAELKKWAPSLVKTSFAFTGFLLAMMLQRFVGGFHAAMRGGRMIAKHGLRLAKKYNLVQEDAFADGSKQQHTVALAIGAFGFAWQVWQGFGVPFPLNLLFLPATIVEWFLTVFISLVPV